MEFTLVQPDSIQTRDSAGYVKDIYDPAVSVRQPLSEYRTMLDLVHSSDVLASAYDITVEFLTYRGWDFIRGTKEKRREMRKKLESLNFSQVIPNVSYGLLYYGDSFLEIVKGKDGAASELHPLETTEMRIIYDKHGNVEGYVQRPFNLQGLDESAILTKEKAIDPSTGETYGVFWKPEEVIHFRMKWIVSQFYSYNPNEPIGTPSATKLYIGNYLMNIFMNLPPRYVAHLAGISKSDYELAKQEFRSSKTNYKKTIAFSRSNDPQSKLQIQKVDAPYDETLLKVKDHIDRQIIRITRVPSHWVLESGTENRGIGESIQLPLQVHLKYIHRNVLEPQINLKLVPSLEAKDISLTITSKSDADAKVSDEDQVEFKFNELSVKTEGEILANLQILQGMGLKPEAMARYLDFNGILGFDEDDFIELSMVPGKAVGMIPSAAGSKAGAKASGKKMDKSMQDMTQNVDSSGVSEESTRKMPVSA